MYVSDARVKILLQLLEKGGVGIDQWTEEKINQLTAVANAMAEGLGEDECDMATSKQYSIADSTIVFGSEVGDDIALSGENISNGAGRQSSFKDYTAITSARSDRYYYYIRNDGWQATPTVGGSLDWHLKFSDGTTPSNDDGTSDAAISAEDKLRNLPFLNEVVCDEAAANIPAAVEGYFRSAARYIGVAFWNRGGSATKNTEAAIKFYLTALPFQQQAT